MKSHTGLVIDKISVLLKNENRSNVVAFATIHLNYGALHLHNFTVIEDRGVVKVKAPFRTKRSGERVETIGFSASAKEFFELAVIEEYLKASRRNKGGV